MWVFINGFGRIGRSVLRAWVEGAARVSRSPASTTLPQPRCAPTFSNSIPSSAPGRARSRCTPARWSSMAGRFRCTAPPTFPRLSLSGTDVVLECTGRADTRDMAGRGLRAGARRVLVSGPSQAADLTVVLGANEAELKHQPIVSNASCTTNALAPLAKLVPPPLGHRHRLDDDDPLLHRQPAHVDTTADYARSRAAALSMVPTTTSAQRLLDIVLPEIAGRIEGSAVRVPTASVSAVDLAVMVDRIPTAAEVTTPP